jgi:hypothetical protein
MLQRTIARSIAALPSQYTPYRWLLNRVIEHGCAGRGATMQLLTLHRSSSTMNRSFQ